MIQFPEVSAYDVPVGSYHAVVDGYYLLMNPLTPGEHALGYKIVYEKPSLSPLKKYAPGEVRYYLTVKP